MLRRFLDSSGGTGFSMSINPGTTSGGWFSLRNTAGYFSVESGDVFK
jgi:hypothetical protein